MAQRTQLWVKRVVVLLLLLKCFLLFSYPWGTSEFPPGRKTYLIQKPQLGGLRIVIQKMMKHISMFSFLKWEEPLVKPLNTRVPSAANAGQQPGKPWPRLHTFTSWTVDPNLTVKSYEAFFGNGFTQAFTDVGPTKQALHSSPKLHPGSQTHAGGGLVEDDATIGSGIMRKLGGGKDAVQGNGQEVQAPEQDASVFQCLYSPALRTSICEGTNMIMNPEKIIMSKGREPLDSVMGRNEEEELPSFTSGAFEVMVPKMEERGPLFNNSMLDRLIPVDEVEIVHTMHQLFKEIRTIPVDKVVCAQRVSTPTVIVTRFEYANLFHTAADWYNAYITSRVTNLKKRPRLVFVDGHCKSPLDDAWNVMFSGVHFARHLTGPVCFDHLIFSPLGYSSPLFRGVSGFLTCKGSAPGHIPNEPSQHPITARVREFGEFFTTAFNMTPESMLPKDDSVLKVLFVRREDYLAHPRHSGRPESRLSNELEVLEALRSWASSRSSQENRNITVVEGLFAHMTLREQLKEVRESSIIVGAHGAGLSHLLFSRPQTTTVLELMSAATSDRLHFELMSLWMGIQYDVIKMTSSKADCSELTRRMDQILQRMLREQGLRVS